MLDDLLYIPDILKRTSKEGQHGRRANPEEELSWVMNPPPFSQSPPQSKTWKGAARRWIHLDDQAPRIGCGRRLVWVKVGRKWAHLCDGYGFRQRVLKSRISGLIK